MQCQISNIHLQGTGEMKKVFLFVCLHFHADLSDDGKCC